MFTTVLAVLVMGQGKLETKDLAPGKGAPAQKGDLLTVQYTGTLLNGTQFDTSVGKAPFAFTLGGGQVIQGWDQGMLGMRVGGKRQLTIPAALGYGDQAIGPIPANSTLKFEVELLRIDKKGAEPKIEVEVLKKGTGPGAADGDQVDVHYKGTFLNGVEFDQSYKRGEPLSIVLGETRLIQGFTQGVRGMKLNEKRKVTIPGALAYGANPRGPIPANMALVFELEVVKLTPKKVNP